MHAFLLTGQTKDNFEDDIKSLSKKLGAQIMEFPLEKIDDVRNLNNLLRLSFNKKTLIVLQNIDKAGEEALNAFLKNLEEPQENIYFALTAKSKNAVLSTIVSRCQLIMVGSNESNIKEVVAVTEFINASVGIKLSIVDKIKDREKAIGFLEDLIFYLHDQKEIRNIDIFIETLNNIKGNGNISLHLTNLVVRMESANG